MAWASFCMLANQVTVTASSCILSDLCVRAIIPLTPVCLTDRVLCTCQTSESTSSVDGLCSTALIIIIAIIAVINFVMYYHNTIILCYHTSHRGAVGIYITEKMIKT